MSAAASLTEAFTKMGSDFETANPGTTVTFNFAASSALVQQIQGGAPADVFASADGTNMQKLVSGGQVTAEPTVFAANELTIVVKHGNPEHVKSLADLANLDVVSLCADAVPCGKYAQQALTQAGVTIPSEKITKGADVKTTLAAVSTGDADAAIVYTTDAEAAGTSVRGRADPRVAERVRHLPDRADCRVRRTRAWRMPGSSTSRLQAARARRPCRASGSFRRRSNEPPGGERYRSRRCSSPSWRWRSSFCPLIGLLKRAPWSDLWDSLSDPAARDAMRLSVECSLWSTLFAVVFGVPLAYVLARARFPGRALVRALVVLPMVLPPVVGGVALLFAFQRNGGLIGSWIYDVFGFQFTFSKWGVVLAETFVAMPFLVITVEARAAHDGPPLRGRRGQPRRGPVDRVPPRHRADDRARAHRGRGAGLGAGAGRVRRHDHLRRQHPGSNADDAAARSTTCSESNQPVGDRVEPRAARGLGGRAGVVARPLVRRAP